MVDNHTADGEGLVNSLGAEGSAGSQNAAVGSGRNIETILRIPVTVQVVLGSTSMPVANLLKLGRGAVIPLDHRVGEPVDVVVNGRVVARGEVVVVEDDTSRFGVSLTEVVGPKFLGGAMNADAGRAVSANRIARKQLNGPEKVAALLLAMGKPLASRLLKHFDQDELRQVTRSIADLGVVPMPDARRYDRGIRRPVRAWHRAHDLGQ